MSDRDRQLLEQAGLSATEAGRLLERSRQAVSKGISGESDYFTKRRARMLRSAATRLQPASWQRVERAIRDVIGDIDVPSAATELDDLEASIATAEKLWIILPNSTSTLSLHNGAFAPLFTAIDRRKPLPLPPVSETGERERAQPVSFDRPLVSDIDSHEDHPQLEVLIFCDDTGVPFAVKRALDEEWGKQHLLTVLQYDLVRFMSPMVVIDPHQSERSGSFGLVADDFQRIKAVQTADWLSTFGNAVWERKKVDLFKASPVQIAEAHAKDRPLRFLGEKP